MAQLGPSDTPQELIDEVIDHCSGDRRTLIACSLTSRAWVYRTRKHLFSKLTLTDKTLPVWCGAIVAPTKTGSRPQPHSQSYPPVSSSYASHWLSSYVTSLQLVATYTPTSRDNFGADELFRAKSHLSAFTHLKSLTLTALSFLGFNNAGLTACFGSLAETVSELKLSMCFLDEKGFPPFLRLFTCLESLEVDGNTWYPSSSTNNIEKDPPTLRGSFTASEFTGENDGLLNFLATAKMECHTVTLGYHPPSTFRKLNILFANCKDHLKTLSLAAPEWNPEDVPQQALDLSLCEKLVEIQARFNHANFERIIPTLKTVVSPRFRKLTLFLIPPIPSTKIQDWLELDEEVTALAERVKATAVSDTLEVLFSSYSTTLGNLVLSDVERALPQMAADARVSLRVEILPIRPYH